MMSGHLNKLPHQRQRVPADAAKTAGALRALHINHQAHQASPSSAPGSMIASHARVPGESEGW